MKDDEELIILDCKIMLKKLGNIPFDVALNKMQNELWNIGNKYGKTGPEVFRIFMDNFPIKEYK